MATLRGSRIRPELANADFSGIARGGRIQGQALANLGEDIAGGIKKYRINKEELGKNIAKNDAIIASNQDILASIEQSGEENTPNGVAKAIKARQNGTFTNQNEAILASYLETLQAQKQAETKAENVRLNQEILQSQVDEVKRQETLRDQRKKFDKLILDEVKNRAEGDEKINLDMLNGVMLNAIDAGIPSSVISEGRKFYTEGVLNEMSVREKQADINQTEAQTNLTVEQIDKATAETNKLEAELTALNQSNADISGNQILLNGALQVAAERRAAGNPFTTAQFISALRGNGYIFRSSEDIENLLKGFGTELLITEEDKKVIDDSIIQEQKDLKQSFDDFGIINNAAKNIITKMGSSGFFGNIGDSFTGNQAGLFGTGWIRFGNDANELEAQLETIQATIGFKKLHKMRQDSPTGGALGNVSNIENRLLQSTSGALAGILQMGEAQGKKALVDFMYNQARVVNRQYEYFVKKYGQEEATRMSGFTPDSIKAVQDQLDEFEKLPDNQSTIRILGGGWRSVSALINEKYGEPTPQPPTPQPPTPPPPVARAVEATQLNPDELQSFQASQNLPDFTPTGASKNLASQPSVTVGNNYTILSVEGD